MQPWEPETGSHGCFVEMGLLIDDDRNNPVIRRERREHLGLFPRTSRNYDVDLIRRGEAGDQRIGRVRPEFRRRCAQLGRISPIRGHGPLDHVFLSRFLGGEIRVDRVGMLGAVLYDMNHVSRAVDLWKEFIARSGNRQNVKMASALLEKIGRGEKDILTDEAFLKDFRWREEGFGPSKKIALFLTACAAEFLLLLSMLSK